ncbi:response regulator [Acidicapsa acidisoli]|uniref:response regulator n=1 Tax=Acidicapsa acidisoli TaxID=1615681 RepID=UPI0021E03774|nr:response regulator [Acidicapsa acidisoli]
MTTESTQPPSEAGQAQAPVPGQSQGHRRRRRRRKTKSSLAAQNQNGFSATGQPQTAPPAPPAPVAQQSAQPAQGHQRSNGSNGSGGSQQGGQGRKKKKARDKQPSFQASPGNSVNGSNGSGGGKKRKQQKGPRQFVGPMDHSYRVANGNIADGPPSTIPFQGNGHGAYYNDTPSPRGAVAPAIAVDAPTRIFFFIEDLFFLAKIQEASRKLGVKVEFVKGDKEVLARITDAPEAERAALLVFDLNNAAAKPLTIIPKLRAKLKKSVSIIGFLSHLQGDLKMKATEAGCDTVMPRSAFSQSLPNLLRRYGMEEEEDNYPQPV